MPTENGSSSSASDVISADESLLSSMDAYTTAVQSGGREDLPGTATPSPSREESDSREAAPPRETRQREEAAPPRETTQQAAPAEGEEEVEQPTEPEELQSEPFSYRADQRDTPFEGIHVFRDAQGEVLGATVDREQLDSLRLRLGRHDHLVVENNRLNGRLGEYDRFTHNGLDRQQYTGSAAIQQLSIENAKLAATVATLAKAIDDPNTLAQIVYEAQQNMPNREWQILQRELKIAAEGAEQRARSQWTMRIEQDRSAAQSSPEALAGNLSGYFDALRLAHPDDFKNFKDSDWAEARATFGPFASQIVRKATAADVRAQPELSVGQLVVDESKFRPWFQERARTRNGEATAAASTSAASRENAARTRAASAGRMSAPARTRPQGGNGKAPAKAEEPSWNDFKDAWMQGRFVMNASDEA